MYRGEGALANILNSIFHPLPVTTLKNIFLFPSQVYPSKCFMFLKRDEDTVSYQDIQYTCM